MRLDLKETHTVYFSSSFYIMNQKPTIPRTDFHRITTWVARSSGSNLATQLLILWFRVYGAIIQYKYLNRVYFVCKTKRSST